MILQVEHLCFSYGDKPVLRDIDLAFESAEITCIVGPNGSGKSTLVRCINALLKPQKGRVLLEGRNTVRMQPLAIARSIGYVPQSTNQFFSSTVFDTVMMGRRPHAAWGSGAQDIDIVLGVLLQLGLGDIAMHDYNQLSGGQQQRVLIARALAQEPKILLLDEPTSALDIAHQLEVMETIHALIQQKGMAAVMVVHDLNLAARYADRIVILDAGRIHAVGSAEETFTEGNIGTVYGVEAAINRHADKPYVIPIKRVCS
jgi:iron complex transport system ATP-binding protein